MPHPETWLKVVPGGLFCEPGGFFIDPTRAVDRAVITHAHSDHARPGHRAVLATADTLAIMQARMGHSGDTSQALGWHEPVTINGVKVWLSPAGHVLGSAQVAMEYQGSRAVVSGDYKRVADPTCAGFEPVACDVFVTEATFALPVFVHPPPDAEIRRLLDSVALFPERTHVVGCYALGKCQRLIALLRQAGWDGPIWLHGALASMCRGLSRARRRTRRSAAGDRGGEGVPGRRHRSRTPRRHRRPLGETAGGSGRGASLGLDAGAPAGQVARCGTSAGHQRSC